MAMIVFVHTEWSGVPWLITVLLPVVLFIVVFNVVYRLIRGKWAKFSATVLGSLAGWAGILLILPWILVFPFVHRHVEGEWPIVYLGLGAILLTVHVVQGFVQRKAVHT
jgi:hypothetical protein